MSCLVSKNNIVFSDKTNNMSVAILGESVHFDKTLIVTLFAGSNSDTKNILLFLQNFGAEKNYKRIQILSKESFSTFNNLEHRLTFHLMQKLLSWGFTDFIVSALGDPRLPQTVEALAGTFTNYILNEIYDEYSD